MKKIQSFWDLKKTNLSLAATTLLMSLTGCAPTASDPYLETTYVHKYGIRVDQDYWTTSGQNGEVINTHRDGATETRTYQSGMLHGRRTLTYPFSTHTKFIEDYENDCCVKRQTFLECGSPDCCTEYSSDGCFTLTYWYNCGTPRCVEKYSNGMLIEAEYYDPQHNRESWVNQGNGERVQRDRFGQFLCMDNIQNGYLSNRTNYHTNGTTREMIPYDGQGNVSGLKRTFHPDGSPDTIETWDGNRQHGTTAVYQNGEKYAEVPYYDGRKHGVERRLKGGETVTQEVSWENGQMHGPTHSYTNDSVQTDWYYKGRLTTQSNYESFNMPRKPIN
jgi:antitoxin component YwqK of YwqJK toxin-antitoxin module